MTATVVRLLPIDEQALLKCYVEGTREFQDEPSIWNNLGGLYFNAKDFAKARQCFERALALDPNHSRANVTLGYICDQEGDQPAARQHYEVALQSAPDAPYSALARDRLAVNLDPRDVLPIKLE